MWNVIIVSKSNNTFVVRDKYDEEFKCIAVLKAVRSLERLEVGDRVNISGELKGNWFSVEFIEQEEFCPATQQEITEILERLKNI